MSICCIVNIDDTLDVATVSACRDADVVSLSPVRSISQTRIERLGMSGLYEALEQFCGVSIKDYGGVGGLKTVSVRNMGASHTSVVYDGIPVSDAQNGQVDISRFNLDDIASVSVTIGVNDDIFCSARHLASAGVLEITSRTPSFEQGPLQLSVGQSAVSIGIYAPYVSLKQKLARGCSLELSADGIFSKGDYPFMLRNGGLLTTERRINSDVASVGGEADLHADFGMRGILKAKVNYRGSERGLPGPVILYTQDAYRRLWDKSLISSVMYDVDCGRRWRLHADIGYTMSSDRHLDSDPVYPHPQDSRYVQNEYSVAARVLWGMDRKWRFAIAEDCFVNTLDSNIPECPYPCRLTSVTALSGQFVGEKISISAFLSGTVMTEKLLVGESHSNRFRLSPMIGLNWNFLRNLHLRASYKDGFRMPTFNDLYYSRVGNTSLRPESAHQFNLGVTGIEVHEWGSVSMTLDAYCNSVKDKIVAVPTMFIWKMRNVGEVLIYGSDVNLSGQFKVAGWIRVHVAGNWSLQYALDVTDPGSKSYHNQIPYTPRHCGGGNVLLETDWFNLGYRVNAVGVRYAKGQNLPSNMLNGYSDHSISINRGFTFGGRHVCRLDVSVEGMNLGNANHEVIKGYPMPGRSWRVRLKFNY